jgi:hypothetical protein
LEHDFEIPAQRRIVFGQQHALTVLRRIRGVQ